MTVYVVQDQRRYDRTTGEFVSKFNLTPAHEYGELRFLLTPTCAPFNLESVVKDLEEGLVGFRPVVDHLLLIGNPILIGLATAIAADASGGDVTFLQWSGRRGGYIPLRAQVFKGLTEDCTGDNSPSLQGGTDGTE